jgi:CheY-like chemotaxis protein
MAERNDYELILMDMQLPTIDGVAVTSLIRASELIRQVPIIALTANAFAEDRNRCLNAGMDDFIAKPFVPEELFAMILKWLQRQTRQ